MNSNSQVRAALWSAPFLGDVPLDATIDLPGSKSLMARALILAAIAKDPTIIRRPLHSRDSILMRDGLRALGVSIEEIDVGGEIAWKVTPHPLTGPARIDVGNAGTVMRFLPPIAAFARGAIQFDGDERSHQRPLRPVIQALEALGVEIEHDSRYSLPMTIHGSGSLAGGEIEVDASSSSQFISALLLAAPGMKGDLTIRHVGSSLPSMPHIEMTISMLKSRGVWVEKNVDPERKTHSWHVKCPSPLNRIDQYRVEPDLSNAAPFLGAVLLLGGRVRIKDWPESTTQAGDSLREIFTRMGAKFTRNGDEIEMSASGRSELFGLDIDLSEVGELAPTIAAVAAFARTPSHLRGIGHLRLHETDRLSALASELGKVGANVIENSDSLEITPVAQSGVSSQSSETIIESYEDHRIATLGALVGLVIPNVKVRDIETTAKTIPDFPGLWRTLVQSATREKFRD